MHCLYFICEIQRNLRGAPGAEPNSQVNLPIPENLVITWPCTKRPSAPQRNQCLLSHFLASLGAQEKTNCTSVLWSIDSCQNRVSADRYHLTIPRAQVFTHQSRVFFEVIRWQITSFKWSQAPFLFIPMIHMKYVVFMLLWPRTVKILISDWPWTRNSASFFNNTGGEDLFLPWSRVGHALRPTFMRWLLKIWQVSLCF